MKTAQTYNTDMHNTALIPASLMRRYKRFLADVRLDDGREVTVHCPNPGAMTGLAIPGRRVWLARASAKARLPYRWQMVETPTSLVGIDTGQTNRLVHDALQQRRIAPLADWQDVTAEVKPPAAISDNSRLDFCLTLAGKPYYLEVKSVTLCDTDRKVALFPDSRTQRGEKHLRCLGALRQQGFAAGILYVIQRSDCHCFDIAWDIDQKYAAAYRDAMALGVDIMAWDCQLSSEDGIALRHPVNIA